MNISKRLANMECSPIRKLVPYEAVALKKGLEVIHLNIGQPDIKTSENFMNAVKRYDEKVLDYKNSQGYIPLIDCFIEYYKSKGVELTRDEVMITNGGSEALQFTFMTICDDGDEVLCAEPFYTNYNNFAAMTGARIVPIPTYAEEGFHIRKRSDIESRITDKTRAILVTNPGNPTGTVYTKEEVKMLCDVAVENDLYIIADEVYREFVYDDIEYTSVMDLGYALKNIILIDSISKRYSACGARIGAIIFKNPELHDHFLKLCQSRLCVAGIEQYAASYLIDTPESYIKDAKEKYEKRRGVIIEGLKKIPGVTFSRPQGAFYIIAGLPVDDAEKFAIWMLTEFSIDNRTVMFAPAAGFYATPGRGKNEVRFSYCLEAEKLEEALELIKLGLQEYNKVTK